MSLNKAEWIWKDGEFIRWEDAQIHLLSLAVQFGSSVFEGIRCYPTPDGPAVFRLDAHLRRLQDSCRIYRMEIGHDASVLEAACLETILRNKLEDCYIRPMVLRGYGDAGMNPLISPIETYIACWPWGAYLGEDGLENGIDACVSSWQRPAPNTFPSHAKAAGHYNNAQLIKMEATANGYAEAIALGPDGLVSEGSGQNLFLVRDGVLMTPPIDGTNLIGITRDAVLAIATDLGIPSREQIIAREMLYTADEAFFSGTATEVTPIRSIDKIAVGTGLVGDVTRAIQQRFRAIVRGEIADDYGWRTPVHRGRS
jgi:branched-chain amino acid aminotransferase